MKRWILGFIVFPISLFIGLFAFHAITSQEDHVELFTIPIPTSDEGDALDSSADDDVAPTTFSESFTDDSHIGRRHENKVELQCVENGGGTLTYIKFFSRKKGREWKKKQSIEIQKLDQLPCDPTIKDLNGDGLKDLTYKSAVAARGANEIRTLFIYDAKKDELVLIANASDYPNLEYNKRLNCLDAWLVYGATATVFLKLEGDRLREFASVETGLQRVVTITDKSGKRRVVSRKNMSEDDIYTRYTGFDPPTP